MCSLLGGRIAEEMLIGEITTGAYDDLERVQKIAYSYVTKFGMSKKLGYGNFDRNNGYNG